MAAQSVCPWFLFGRGQSGLQDESTFLLSHGIFKHYVILDAKSAEFSIAKLNSF